MPLRKPPMLKRKRIKETQAEKEARIDAEIAALTMRLQRCEAAIAVSRQTVDRYSPRFDSIDVFALDVVTDCIEVQPQTLTTGN